MGPVKRVADHIHVRDYMPSDEAAWVRMRLDLWPDSDRADAHAWALRTDVVTLVAEDARTYDLVGFAEVGKRLYADGCETNPVAFLEGWFVSPETRGAGVGSKLVQAAGMWAKDQGLQELASDSLLNNEPAYRAHLSAGFEEVERSIKYRLSLADPE